MKLLSFMLPFLLAGCSGDTSASYSVAGYLPEPETPANTLAARFSAPAGFRRNELPENSFGYYLRHIPLKPEGSKVHLYDGRIKEPGNVYRGVVSMDIGSRDLQQCADAVMRLRAEYLFHTGQGRQIHFNFTNGFRADYQKWMEGKRISVSGNRISWVANGRADSSYGGFRAYMDLVFNYAGTLSLSRELKSVPYAGLRAGDVLIKGGSPGHAVIVMDVAVNSSGSKVYMLAQSYMPAQEIQILCNPADPSSVWFALDPGVHVIETPEWTFYPNELRRFGDE